MHRFTFKKLRCFTVIIFLFILFSQGSGLSQVRTEIKIPDILGYVTLKCDFHMHTVFSDGNVWPTVRAEEAWREGLDAFSISDHIEYQPHKDDIPTNHNRSFELARPHAEGYDLIIIRAAEITRSMPPGHINAIFLKDADALDTEDYRDAINAAVDQGGFVFWNHPGWKGQQPDGISRWYDNHTEIYEKGWMHGIEVVNGPEYYPNVHRWCLEKKLTLLGNSDVHAPMNLNYLSDPNNHRSMTLVFATAKTPAALKEALFERRTAVYMKNMLIGDEKFLKPIFHESIEIRDPNITLKGRKRAAIQIHNKSQVPFELVSAGEVQDLSVPENITLYPDKTAIITLRAISDALTDHRRVSIPYKVENLLIAPEEGLPVNLDIDVTFIPADN